MLRLPKKQRVEAREPSKQQCSFEYREELVGKDISHFFCYLIYAALNTIVLRPTSMTVKRLKKVKLFFYPMLLDFRKKKNCHLECSISRSFFDLVRATCRHKVVSGIGGLILTGENRILGGKRAPVASFYHKYRMS
jgi:hypothetical protein